MIIKNNTTVLCDHTLSDIEQVTYPHLTTHADGYPPATEDLAEIEKTTRTKTIGGDNTWSGREC